MSLSVEQIGFAYPGRPPLLRDISFTVGSAETLCLLGPNGAGKTTLLRCLLGINRISRGRILIGGEDTAQFSRKRLALAAAYVPQSGSVLFSFTSQEIVLMGRTPHLGMIATPSAADHRHAAEAMERIGIAHLAGSRFVELSGGERQLVLLARALCQNARVLVMDEPTANLDYGNQVRILRIVNELRTQGYTVVMSAHNPDQAFAAASHAAILRQGRIVAFGDPHTVVTAESLTELYGTAIAVIHAGLPQGAGQAKVCIPLI